MARFFLVQVTNKREIMKKGLITVVILMMFILSTSVLAQTFNVSTTQELRQALLDAAFNDQADTIILADGTYKTIDFASSS